MSARQHLKELQFRLMVVAAFFVVGACVAYFFEDKLIPFLMAPLGKEKLVYLSPLGGASFVFMVAMYFGIAFAFPVLVQQFYAFLRPALPEKAQRRSPKIIISSLLLLLAGAAFGYFVAVPSALHALYGFADKYVQASITADSFLKFIIAYTVGIGIVFQIPLLLLLLHSAKPLTPGGLRRSEKWVVLVAFLVAGFVIPTPDLLSQAVIAVPIILIYQVGVVAVLWRIHKQRQAEKHLVIQAPNRETAPKVTPLPAPTPLATSPATYAVRPRGIDGFTVISRPTARFQPSTPSHVTAVKAPVTPVRPKSSPKTFSIEGIIRQPATSF